MSDKPAGEEFETYAGGLGVRVSWRIFVDQIILEPNTSHGGFYGDRPYFMSIRNSASDDVRVASIFLSEDEMESLVRTWMRIRSEVDNVD